MSDFDRYMLELKERKKIRYQVETVKSGNSTPAVKSRFERMDCVLWHFSTVDSDMRSVNLALYR